MKRTAWILIAAVDIAIFTWLLLLTNNVVKL